MKLILLKCSTVLRDALASTDWFRQGKNKERERDRDKEKEREREKEREQPCTKPRVGFGKHL